MEVLQGMDNCLARTEVQGQLWNPAWWIQQRIIALAWVAIHFNLAKQLMEIPSIAFYALSFWLSLVQLEFNTRHNARNVQNYMSIKHQIIMLLSLTLRRIVVPIQKSCYQGTIPVSLESMLAETGDSGPSWSAVGCFLVLFCVTTCQAHTSLPCEPPSRPWSLNLPSSHEDCTKLQLFYYSPLPYY